MAPVACLWMLSGWPVSTLIGITCACSWLCAALALFVRCYRTRVPAPGMSELVYEAAALIREEELKDRLDEIRRREADAMQIRGRRMF
jgi:hypothetical protein